jgi:hypothetical protein
VCEGGTSDDRRSRVRLGIKAKGKASADSFIVARTQLYQSLYWHHTFRAIKSMFLTAAAYALNHFDEVGGQPEQGRLQQDIGGFLQGLYFDYVFLRPLGIKSPVPKTTDRKKKTKGQQRGEAGVSPEELLQTALGHETQLRGLGGAPVDRTLAFFFQIGPANAKELLKALVERRLFKRLIELPFSAIDANVQEQLVRMLRNAKSRAKVTEQLEAEFRSALTAGLQRASKTQESLKEDEGRKLLEKAWAPGATIAVDAPLRELGKIQRSPKAVSDVKRKYSHETRGLPESTQSALWGDNVPKIMRESAYLRIFVKPEVHDLILRFMPYPDRKEIFDRVFGLRG